MGANMPTAPDALHSFERILSAGDVPGAAIMGTVGCTTFQGTENWDANISIFFYYKIDNY